MSFSATGIINATATFSTTLTTNTNATITTTTTTTYNYLYCFYTTLSCDFWSLTYSQCLRIAPPNRNKSSVVGISRSRRQGRTTTINSTSSTSFVGVAIVVCALLFQLVALNCFCCSVNVSRYLLTHRAFSCPMTSATTIGEARTRRNQSRTRICPRPRSCLRSATPRALAPTQGKN